MSSFNKDYFDKDVIIGVRPRAISVNGDLSYVEQGLNAKINLFEQLGEDTILYCSVDGLENDLIISTTGLSRFQINQIVNYSFDFTNICVFDKETKESLL